MKRVISAIVSVFVFLFVMPEYPEYEVDEYREVHSAREISIYYEF